MTCLCAVDAEPRTRGARRRATRDDDNDRGGAERHIVVDIVAGDPQRAPSMSVDRRSVAVPRARRARCTRISNQELVADESDVRSARGTNSARPASHGTNRRSKPGVFRRLSATSSMSCLHTLRRQQAFRQQRFADRPSMPDPKAAPSVRSGHVVVAVRASRRAPPSPRAGTRARSVTSMNLQLWCSRAIDAAASPLGQPVQQAADSDYRLPAIDPRRPYPRSLPLAPTSPHRRPEEVELARREARSIAPHPNRDGVGVASASWPGAALVSSPMRSTSRRPADRRRRGRTTPPGRRVSPSAAESLLRRTLLLRVHRRPSPSRFPEDAAARPSGSCAVTGDDVEARS